MGPAPKLEVQVATFVGALAAIVLTEQVVYRNEALLVVPATQVELIGVAGVVVVVQLMLVQALPEPAVWFAQTGLLGTLTLTRLIDAVQIVRMNGEVDPPVVPGVQAGPGVAAEVVVLQAVVM